MLVNSEGGEAIFRNENGDTIIVPRNRRNEAMKYLLKDDHHSLDKLALDLPKAESYAQGGTVIPEDPIEGMMGPETTITADNPKKSIGNFLNRWGYEHSKDPATSFLGAVGQGLGAIAQLPQAAATYLSSPKGRVLPSQAIQDSGYNEKVKAFANRNPNMVGALAQLTTKPGIQNFALDPLNYVGGEFLKGEKALINDLPIENGKIYKQDWLQGYKQVEVPKPTSNFKSEINWGQWNKEIPDNPQLMKEYNAIEQQAKADDTWMKNPDGSVFRGTPEQFIQQNSENFKKAFGNSKLINPDGSYEPVVHSTKAKFDEFDKSYFGQTDEGYHGEGFYFSPIQRTGFEGEFYQRPYKWIDNKTVQGTHNYGKNKMMLYVKPDKIVGDFPVDPFTEIITDLNKPGNIKSAIGNNGMFDMTNPNIYKTIVGGLASGALGKRKKE